MQAIVNGARVTGRFDGTIQPTAVQTNAGPFVAQYLQSTVLDVQSDAPIPWTIRIGRPQGGPMLNGGSVPPPTIGVCESDPDPAGCFVTIRYGSESAEQILQVDCGLGCTIPVFGSRVKVDVGGDLTLSLLGPGLTIPTPGNIPISITPGVAMRPVTPLMRTISVGTLNATVTSGKFTLPAFTSRIEHAFKTAGAVAPSRTLRFYSRNAAASATEYLYTGANRRDPSYPEWTAALPVPWNASKVEMTNNEAALVMSNIVFLCQLAL